MGLLDVFRKKAPAQVAPPAEEPRAEVYSGMRVEVTAFNGRMLFEAKLMNPREGQATLLQYSESMLSPEEPPCRVRIRGYNAPERRAVYMEGTISPLPKHTWQVEELAVVQTGNDRAFFRLDTDLEGSVMTLGGGFGGFGGGEHPCRVLNISIGGACVGCGQRFHEGDKFLLKVKLMEDRDTSIMFCQIMRVTDKGEGKFEYGCRFLEMNDADEARITQNIFAAQRKKRSV